MSESKIIKEVEIKSSESYFGDTAAWVLLEDQEDGSVSEGLLFVWFKDKIHFSSTELLELTVLEAHRLRHQKHRQS